MKKLILFSTLLFSLFTPTFVNAQLTRMEFSRWDVNIIESAWFDEQPGLPILVVYTSVTAAEIPSFIDTIAVNWNYESGMKAKEGMLGGWIWKNHQHHDEDVAKSGAWATWSYNNKQELYSLAGIVTQKDRIKTSMVDGKLVLQIYLSSSQVSYLKCAKALPPYGKAFKDKPEVLLYD